MQPHGCRAHHFPAGPNGLVNRVKIALRRDPLLPVAELGIEAGLSEPEALESVFRKTAGMSLERYRDALSAGSEPAA